MAHHVDPGNQSEFRATAGKPLAEGEAVATPDAVVAALCTVYDPEIPVNIYELGLIYEKDIGSDGSVKIKMSLTAPGCPVAGEMPGMVADAVAAIDGVGEVEVLLVWDPPWDKSMMSDDARLALNID